MNFLLFVLISGSSVFSPLATGLQSNKTIHGDNITYREGEYGSFEHRSRRKSGFDINGTLRKQFALDVGLAESDTNMVCSPLSALLPLGKLVMGTKKSQSRDELLEALGMKKKKVKSTLKSLMRDLKAVSGVKLSVASRIYVSNKVDIRKKFVKDTKSVFKSSVETVDFKAPVRTAKIINDWVSEQTNDNIRSIIDSDEITPATSIVLVNAVYFAGEWEYPFSRFKYEKFIDSEGNNHKALMMIRNGAYKYYNCKTLNAKFIEIPYKGNSASFVIVLPSSGSLELLLEELKVTPELLNDAMAKMKETQVSLTMPMFKIETELDLKLFYNEMGVESIFNPKDAAFGRMSKDDVLYVSSAIQKSVIEVNQRGTEASSASGVSMAKLSAYGYVKFRADRPFLFYVKVGRHQAFAGTFVNPKGLTLNVGLYDIFSDVLRKIKEFAS